MTDQSSKSKKPFTVIYQTTDEGSTVCMHHVLAESAWHAGEMFAPERIQATGEQLYPGEGIGLPDGEIVVLAGHVRAEPQHRPDPTLEPRDVVFHAVAGATGGPCQAGCLIVRGLRRVEGSELLVGWAELMGLEVHVHLIRVALQTVAEGAPDQVQEPWGDLAGNTEGWRLWEDLERIEGGNAPLQTTEVPGFEGEYVPLVTPFCR
jgi:hypothetical protein